MEELLNGLGLDPSLTGMTGDAGLVLATNEMTNLLKEDIRKFGLERMFNRLYPVIPFAVSFGFALVLGHALWSDALGYAGRIGVLANFAWQAHRVSVKGA